MDTTKELPDNKYAFQYRAKYALYLKKFAFYDRAQEVLTGLLKDMIAYFNLETEQGEESAFPKIKLDQLQPVEGLQDSAYIQVRDIYFQLGKIFVFKLKEQDAVSCFEIARDITQRAFLVENDRHLFIANCYRFIKEAYLKVHSQRNKQALEKAEEANKKTLAIIQCIIGEDKPNYLLARALLGEGEILVSQKKVDEAEKVVLKAQTMIGTQFSENHPCIIDFNSNLVEVYSNKTNEGEKAKTVQVATKNLEIAR